MKIRKLIYDTLEIFCFYIIYLFFRCISVFSLEKIEKHTFNSDVNYYKISLTGDIDGRKEYINNCVGNTTANIISYYSKDKEEITSLGSNFFLNVRNKKNFILEFNNISIGYICIDNCDNNLQRSLLKTYINLKKMNADIVYLYLIDIDVEPTLFRKISYIGFDGIVYINRNEYTFEKRGYKNIKKMRIYKNLGGYLDVANLVIPYDIVIHHEYYKYKNKWIISKQAFDVATTNVDLYDEIVNRVESKFFDLPYYRDLISVGELTDAIGVSIPLKYNYLSKFSVLNICARVAEVGPNSLFFFRQPLKHNNDKWRVANLFYFRMPMLSFFKGATLIISYKKLPSFIPHIVVEDTIEAHIKAIDWYRNKKYPLTKTVCITGSIGKTTTKDMLFSVLSKRYNTEKSQLNTNVQAKIGINMQRLKKNTEVYIQEVGGGRPCGASKHARMVNPNVAVITNIGTAHIGNFKSKEDLFKNKLGIIEGLKPGGILFLNGDDEFLLKAKTPFKQIYFSVYNKDADYYVQNVKEYRNSQTFDIVSKDEIVKVKLNVNGLHNILNAVCCFAVGKTFGMSNNEIIEGLSDFKTSGSRQNVINVGRLKVIADCYNASYESVVSSLELLNQVDCSSIFGKKIVVLGDITGLGKEKKNIYSKLAGQLELCAADKIVFYVNEESEIAQLLTDKGVLLYSANKLLNWLDENVQDCDVVLFKGSSKSRLDEIIDSFLGLNISDTRYFEESKSIKVNKGLFSYDVFEKYATIVKYYGKEAYIKVSGRIYGRNVKKVKGKAFYGNSIVEHISLPPKTIHIGDWAFASCNQLKKVSNMDNVRCIGKNAFYKNYSLEHINLSEKLLIISENSFAECYSLKEIVIPQNVLFIGKNAFKNCFSLETVYIKGNPLIEKRAFSGCNNVKIIDYKNLHKEVI